MALAGTPFKNAGFYSAKNEAVAEAKGVKRVCIPNRSEQREPESSDAGAI
jgi:hypothetical protein